MQKVAENYLS